MPAVSLVVCVHGERSLLERLLEATTGCYDGLIVIHDGREHPAQPETAQNPPAIDYALLPADFGAPAYQIPDEPAVAGSVHELVEKFGGTYFEGPRCFQQEPHWPFAWSQARHDWILRLDADEIPSPGLRDWLRAFRGSSQTDKSTSGYTCIWPLWNGLRTVTKIWPAGRIFLFHKQRVRFFGMVEQVPIPDAHFEPTPFILEHCPSRKSFGLGNVLLRPQAYHWRRVIAKSLLGQPTDLPCWRWTNETWPLLWEQIRAQPFRTALWRLLAWPARTAIDIWKAERKLMPIAAAGGGLHHFLICVTYWRLRWLSRPPLPNAGH